MRRAISLTQERRARQQAYSADNGIDPQTIRKAVGDILASLRGTEGTPVPGRDRRSWALDGRHSRATWPTCPRTSCVGSF